eukprot:COSAG02_NODE_100_length_36897_cov_9.681749_28_plen_45_part_00
MMALGRNRGGGGVAEGEGSRRGRDRGIGGIAYRLGDSGRHATPF